jgi:predicted DNA binding CopG/RHH family protein
MRELKTAQIVTRVTERDREWLDKEADRQGLDTSSFIRMTLRQARVASERGSGPHAA